MAGDPTQQPVAAPTNTGIGPGQQTPSVTSSQDLANAALNPYNPPGGTPATGQAAIKYGDVWQDAASVANQEATNPYLPQGSQATYQSIVSNPNDELQNGTGSITGATPAGQQVATAGQATASSATAGQATNTAAQAYGATAASNPGAATYSASTIGSMTPQAIAAQGTVDPRSLMQNQYTQLLDFPPNQVPDWAKGAVSTANASLAAHGLSSSSVAGQAITSALMSAALPIASNDANVFATMNLTNLSNQQQAVIVNTQARVQTMMSDQAAENASKQFNATSTNQTNQFYGQLATQVSQFNAAQLTAVSQSNAASANQTSQFNASQETAVSQSNAALSTQTSQFNATQNTATSEFNAGQGNAIAQFNANLQQNAQEFNANNALVIAQSNVQWQRQINTANTAGINQANNTNAANLLNISNTAMNNIWQQMRDQASYSFTAGQNAQNRAAAFATTNLNSQNALAYLNANYSLQQQAALGQAIGGFASNLLGQGLNSLFGGSSNPSGLTALNGSGVSSSGSVTGVGDLGGSVPQF